MLGHPAVQLQAGSCHRYACSMLLPVMPIQRKRVEKSTPLGVITGASLPRGSPGVMQIVIAVTKLSA